MIGLAPTHLAFKDEGGVKAVDFNVGKSDRSGMKVTGKRKKVIFWFSCLDFVYFKNVRNRLNYVENVPSLYFYNY